MMFVRRHAVPLFFGVLTLLMLGPMLAPGYILTMDMVWGPSIPLSWSDTGFNNAFLLMMLLHCLSLVLPSWIVQKLFLVALVFLLFFVPWRWLPFVIGNKARLFAAGVYALNPFVYSRMLAGQWMVLLGYALLPLVFHALILLYRKPDRRHTLHLAGILTALSMTSIHLFYLACIVTVAWAGAYAMRAIRIRSFSSPFRLMIATGASIMIVACVSLYWIIPAIMRPNPVEAQFDVAHFTAFAATQHAETPVLLTVAALGGFWAEGLGWHYYFVWPQDTSLFWIACIILWCLIVLGIVVMMRDSARRFDVIILVITGTMAYILALGAADTPFRDLNLWFYNHVPMFAGLRDSHKIVALLAIVYAILAGVGFGTITRIITEKRLRIAPYMSALLLIPAITGMYQWNGFAKQLVPTEYPDSWYEARTYLTHVPQEEKVLVLPWHGYLSLAFDHNLIVANPASDFFGHERIVASKSIDVGNVHTQTTDPAYQSLEAMLERASSTPLDILRNALKSRGIAYILVLKNEHSAVNMIDEVTNVPVFPFLSLSSATIVNDDALLFIKL